MKHLIVILLLNFSFICAAMHNNMQKNLIALTDTLETLNFSLQEFSIVIDSYELLKSLVGDKQARQWGQRRKNNV